MIRRYFFLWLALVLLPAQALAAAPEMAGIFPAVASPGSIVTIIGGPFEQQVQIVFGDRTLSPIRIAQKQLTFFVPQLAEGDYLLFFAGGGATLAAQSVLSGRSSRAEHNQPDSVKN